MSPPFSAPSAILDGDLLQEVNRLRLVGRVVSNVAHDINNALQVVNGSSELLALKSTIGPVEQRRLQSISTQTGRVATILDRLSSYARSAGADGRVVADLAELADTAVSLRAFTLGRGRITVRVERDTPPYRSSVVRRSILQLFLNVLVNAEDALKGRHDGTILISVGRTRARCSVSFTDNGPGISTEARLRALETAMPPVPQPDLSGIGLWVSRRIAAQHGGALDIAVASGTTVTLTLPAVV
jgi:two-component system C4-dicarboxylate transport sensor histidine kinase DctB